MWQRSNWSLRRRAQPPFWPSETVVAILFDSVFLGFTNTKFDNFLPIMKRIFSSFLYCVRIWSSFDSFMFCSFDNFVSKLFRVFLDSYGGIMLIRPSIERIVFETKFEISEIFVVFFAEELAILRRTTMSWCKTAHPVKKAIPDGFSLFFCQTQMVLCSVDLNRFSEYWNCSTRNNSTRRANYHIETFSSTKNRRKRTRKFPKDSWCRRKLCSLWDRIGN